MGSYIVDMSILVLKVHSKGIVTNNWIGSSKRAHLNIKMQPHFFWVPQSRGLGPEVTHMCGNDSRHKWKGSLHRWEEEPINVERMASLEIDPSSG